MPPITASLKADDGLSFWVRGWVPLAFPHRPQPIGLQCDRPSRSFPGLPLEWLASQTDYMRHALLRTSICSAYAHLVPLGLGESGRNACGSHVTKRRLGKPTPRFM